MAGYDIFPVVSPLATRTDCCCDVIHTKLLNLVTYNYDP